MSVETEIALTHTHQELSEDSDYKIPKIHQRKWDIATMLADPGIADGKGNFTKYTPEEIVLKVHDNVLSRQTGRVRRKRIQIMISQMKDTATEVVEKIKKRERLATGRDRIFYDELFKHIQEMHPERSLAENDLFEVFGLEERIPTAKKLGLVPKMNPTSNAVDFSQTPPSHEEVVYDVKLFLDNIRQSNEISRREKAREREALRSGE